MRSCLIIVLGFALGVGVFPLGADIGHSGKKASKSSSTSGSSRVPSPVTPKASSGPPRVYTPSVYRQPRPLRSSFPWKQDITATVFWIGERPTKNNPTPNHKSSWDPMWMTNFGGYDHPSPEMRTRGYRPKGFVPRQNPFYVALPYNDVDRGGTKPEARRVVPWFEDRFERDGKTVLKGQWVVIRHGKRVCFAQWEDCGPFQTDDWQYVFGRARPKNPSNGGAGIDLSPAVRDYLELRSGAKVDWRFASVSEVRNGPWKYFGTNNPFAKNRVPPQAKIDQLYEQRARSLRAYRQP